MGWCSGNVLDSHCGIETHGWAETLTRMSAAVAMQSEDKQIPISK
jgi:hypothetical protein